MFRTINTLAVLGITVVFAGSASAQGVIYLPIDPYAPQQPVILTPETPTNINPFTGGIDTRSTQIDNTFFDPNRNASMNNGSMRQVDRPIYDTNGNVVGRQSGVEWYNPSTGRWHGNVNNQTLNNQGGVSNQQQFYAPNPNAGGAKKPATPINGNNGFRPIPQPGSTNGFRPNPLPSSASTGGNFRPTPISNGSRPFGRP